MNRKIDWLALVNEIVCTPKSQQLAKLKEIIANIELTHPEEEWNTHFGTDSIYEAWSRTWAMQKLYENNRNTVAEILANKSDFTIIEIGGGNGALWEGFFTEKHSGKFVLIDPVESSHKAVQSKLPNTMEFESHIDFAQNVELPPADIIISSLTIEHIPGFDKKQNEMFGIDSTGKFEVMKQVIDSIRKKNGTFILNDSDIYTDILLPVGDATLIDILVDGYVNRAARQVADHIKGEDLPAELLQKFEYIILEWCFKQVEKVAFAPMEKRDVYEFDSVWWHTIIEKAGGKITSEQFNDPWHLFKQYVVI